MLKKVFAIVFLLLATSSCIKESFENKGLAEYGNDYQTIYFGSVETEKIDISTRSTLHAMAESRIMDIFVAIYDSDSVLVYKHFFNKSERVYNLAELPETNSPHLWFVEEKDPESTDPSTFGYTNGLLRIKCPSVTNGRIYLIANLDDEMFNISSSTLSLLNHERELYKVIARLNEPSIFRMGNFMMTGKAGITSVSEGNIVLNNGPDGNNYSYEDSQIVNDKKIMLRRIDAKIKFSIGIVPGAITHRTESISGTTTSVDQEIESFEPISWQVFNLPKGSFLGTFPEDADPEQIMGFFDTPVYAFETKTSGTYPHFSTGDPTSRTLHGFSFYMLENRESTRKKKSASTYHDRDKRLKDENGAYTSEAMWEYASENATYVKITGNVVMKYQEQANNPLADLPKQQTLHALATYYIHLGDFSSLNGFNDYDILRNYQYNYIVNIKGVDKIQVEVERDEASLPNAEEQSGATGEVTVSQEDIIIFDSHYSQKVYCFNVDGMIKHSDGDINNLTWYVTSPFGNNGSPMKVGEDKVDIPTGLDYKWVHFLVNSKEASYTELPGTVGEKNVTNTYYPNYCQLNRYWPGADSPNLMYVLQFCDYLRKQIKAYQANEPNDFDSQGNIYVTVFIDEFYYDIEPISKIRINSLWRNFVNQPMRTMHIMCNNSVSKDGESTIIKSAVSIRQLSIQTIFNTEVAEEGWGCETEDEFDGDAWFFSSDETRSSLTVNEAIKNFGTNAKNISVNNGLYNSGQMWGLLDDDDIFVEGTLWSDYTNYSKPNGTIFLKDDVDKRVLRYSCLTRNRDENGNGVIDKEEIKWYTASAGQLQDLYLGQNGLTSEARLYNLEITDSGKTPAGYYKWRNHIVSSTASNKNGPGATDLNYRPQFIWSEEGVSVSQYGMDNNWAKPGKYSVRCVRNLEKDTRVHKDLCDIDDYPTPVVEATKIDGKWTFDFSRLNNLSKRLKVTGELLPLDENSTMSLLSDGFEFGDVVKVTGTNTIRVFNPADYKETFENLKSGISLCPGNYRMPNMRELAVAYIYIPRIEPNIDSFWTENGSLSYYNLCCNNYSFGDPLLGGNGFDTAADVFTFGVRNDNYTVEPFSFSAKGVVRCVRDTGL